MNDLHLPYYDDVWFVLIEEDEEDRVYRRKAGVTRWLRIRGLRESKYDRFPTQRVEVYDHHPFDDDGVFVASISAPLWMQLVAGKRQT